MDKASVKIGWVENREGVYGSAVDYETSTPLGAISIIRSGNRYDITAYNFSGEIKTDWMDKNQDMQKIKGLARAMMLALLEIN